eukprot:CAMPEP_0185755318 /NCGR_PEP_ID=MMETSP1174-20130828/13833_1 /TAXON_ID=35687 /ORGANISM="Dictyocha speculum, Strain CCMP1381" /LENGTH=287 /DNA_ID=CAMNT_0028433829 /DNA_START=49 /DNA_END=912 /DNA_ORIENTATION=+
MMGRLRGVAVVTGAGRGIGASCARILSQHGASVIVNDLSETEAAAVVSEIQAAGGEALAVAGSVTDSDFPEHLMQTAANHWDDKELRYVVNNAGFLWDSIAHTMTDDQWDAILACHITAPFRLCRAAATFMRADAKAEISAGVPLSDRCVVNVSSTSGLHGNIGQVNYATAKAGVVGLTKTLAKEWGPLGIRCNAVAFGMISTRMTSSYGEEGGGETVEVRPGVRVQQGIPDSVAKAWMNPQNISATTPLARPGHPDEAAAGVMLMASPYASYITGHTLEVTGGMGI